MISTFWIITWIRWSINLPSSLLLPWRLLLIQLKNYWPLPARNLKENIVRLQITLYSFRRNLSSYLTSFICVRRAPLKYHCFIFLFLIHTRFARMIDFMVELHKLGSLQFGMGTVATLQMWVQLHLQNRLRSLAAPVHVNYNLLPFS